MLCLLDIIFGLQNVIEHWVDHFALLLDEKRYLIHESGVFLDWFLEVENSLVFLDDIVYSVLKFEWGFPHGLCHYNLIEPVFFMGHLHCLFVGHFRSQGFDTFQGGVDWIFFDKFVDFVALSDDFLNFFGQILPIVDFAVGFGLIGVGGDGIFGEFSDDLEVIFE